MPLLPVTDFVNDGSLVGDGFEIENVVDLETVCEGRSDGVSERVPMESVDVGPLLVGVTVGEAVAESAADML